MNTPQFTPKSIGTIWTDPSGKKWKYTPQGWIEEGSGNIATDNKNKGSFIVKPEDTEIVNTLKLGGANDQQIQDALSKRSEILSIKQTDSEQPITEETPIETTIGKKTTDPFSGKSRTEVLRDAFNNGVTSSKELEEIGKIYDTLASSDKEMQDFTTMDPVAKEATKEKLKSEAIIKMQSLPDATSRENALGALSTFKTGGDLISMLEAGKVKTGLVEGFTRSGVFGIGKRKIGKTTEEEDYFNALSETFAANFRKAMSGTAVSDVEMARLERFLPSESKTVQDNVQGITALSDYLSDRTSLQLGMDISLLKPDKSSNDPLNLSGGGVSKNNPLGI